MKKASNGDHWYKIDTKASNEEVFLTGKQLYKLINYSKIKPANDYLQEAYNRIEVKQSSKKEDIDPILLNAMEEYADEKLNNLINWIDLKTSIHNKTANMIIERIIAVMNHANNKNQQ